MNNKVYYDWTRSIIRRNMNGFDVIVIPKNTILYQGIGLSKRKGKISMDNDLMKNFFGNLPVASYYAFSSDFSRGEYGKVITYITIRNLILLDMDSINNYDYLYELGYDVPEGISPNEDIIKYAFGYDKKERKLTRYSHQAIDSEFVTWLCDLHLQNIDGYSYTELPDFHPEVFICDTEDKIIIYPLEYRFVRTYKDDHIIETFDGEYTGTDIPTSSLIYSLGNGKYNVVEPIWSNYLYCPTKDKSDIFLLNEPFVSLRHDYQKRYNLTLC